jgi:hypothetical protein
VASVVPHDAVWGDARIAASDVSNAKANAKQTLAMLRRTRRRNSGEPEAGLAAPVQPANAPSDGVVWSTRPRKTPSTLFLPGSSLVPNRWGRRDRVVPITCPRREALGPTCVYRKPYPGLLSEESAKLAR